MFRTKHKAGKTPVYAIRDKQGRFKNLETVKRAMRRDRKQHAKTKVRSGQGFRGDTV